jgi:hypothetical protein
VPHYDAFEQSGDTYLPIASPGGVFDSPELAQAVIDERCAVYAAAQVLLYERFLARPDNFVVRAHEVVGEPYENAPEEIWLVAEGHDRTGGDGFVLVGVVSVHANRESALSAMWTGLVPHDLVTGDTVQYEPGGGRFFPPPSGSSLVGWQWGGRALIGTTINAVIDPKGHEFLRSPNP